MGVELNKFRKPVAYHVLTYHPGDYDYTTSGKSPKHVRIPADRMIHLYDPNRAGQSRGEPWMTSAISAMKQLGALREAAVVLDYHHYSSLNLDLTYSSLASAAILN